MTDQQIKFGIELPKSLHKSVKITVAQRGVKMKQAAMEAFSRWVKNDTPVIEAGPALAITNQPTEGDTPDIEKLRKLLNKADRTAEESAYYKIIRTYLDEVAVPEHKREGARKSRRGRKGVHG